MTEKIDSEVREALNEVDGNTYVRLHCWLNDPQLSNDHREQLVNEMFCIHLMQTSKIAEVEVPRRFVEEISAWDEVKQIKSIKVY